ncbi:hypothetical protein VNO78_28243 [Psophocarpus tetragonolobus]|uniref:Uncharacterized protein n=1 Tax=Psophocarpus tetragonolobus TaxID=3891 RepID=A0AAN9XBF5_PSOTE
MTNESVICKIYLSKLMAMSFIAYPTERYRIFNILMLFRILTKSDGSYIIAGFSLFQVRTSLVGQCKSVRGAF